jgi:anaerobic selenocysteine-containing dehydrogenase
MERTDLLAWTDDYVRIAPAVVEPGAERRPLWWVAAQLGDRLGIEILDGRHPDEMSDVDMVASWLAAGRSDLGDPMQAGPYGVHIPPVYGHMRRRIIPGGRWNILPAVLLDRLTAYEPPDRTARAFTLVSGRQAHRSNSDSLVEPAKNRDRAVACINPVDAVELGIADGDMVRVSGDVGDVVVAAQQSDELPVGVVWIPHGWTESNVAALCSDSVDLDLLTGQPAMTSLQVSVERIRTPGEGG